MKGFRAVGAIIALGVAALAFYGAWLAEHPETNDPKGMQYWLWKHGLHSMDYCLASRAAYIDHAGQDVVGGKTPAEISKFFPLVTPERATPIERRWYKSLAWTVQWQVLFIANCDIAVVFDHGRAIRVTPLKE